MNNGIAINVVFSKDSLSSEDIHILEQELSENGITLNAQQRSLMVNASCDFFVPLIEIVVSDNFLVSIAAAAAWDALKYITRFLYDRWHGKRIEKIYPNKTVEEDPNIQFVIGENHIKLPVNVDQKKFEYATDKFFDYVSTHTYDQATYIFYNEKDGSLITKTEKQTLADEYKEQMDKSQ